MELFKWMGVGISTHASSSAPNGIKDGGQPINHADNKQFGLENFGNTCYANAVLQALYFCQPFRELVCDSHDKSNPPIPPPPRPSPPPISIPSPPPSRPAALKGFRRRDSTTDSAKQIDDPLPNGNTQMSPRRPSSSSVSGTIPIPPTPPTLFSALRSLYLHIALNPADRGTVSPLTFINKLKMENELYRSSMHQDAHEFLNFLLNKIVEDLEAEVKKNLELSEELPRPPGSLSAPKSSSSSSASPSRSNAASSDSRNTHTTFVHSLFEGTLTSETRCLTCETVSSRDESFLDLSIDIEQNSSVTACLRQFSASEMLSQKNKFFCDSCGGLQEAERRMKIKKLPNVLALHLKRFKYQEDVQKYIKLAYRVAFPLELRLFNTVDDAEDPDRLYSLFAIVVHIGGGPHHGHYIAIVKAHGTWLIFDDDNVEQIRESDIAKYFGESQGGAGYVLFYQAADLDLSSTGLDPTAASASEAGEALPDTEAESAGDNVSVAPTTPASPPLPTSSPVRTKAEIPVVIEPNGQSRTQTPAAPSVAQLNGFFKRGLRHSQSTKLGGDKKHLPSQGVPNGEPLSPQKKTLVNGDTSSAHSPQPPPLTRSLSFKGKDKDSSAGWFSGRRKDKKDKRPPIPPLPVKPTGHLDRDHTHEDRSPSAPGQLETQWGSPSTGNREPRPSAPSPSPPLPALPTAATIADARQSPRSPKSPSNTLARPSTSPSLPSSAKPQPPPPPVPTILVPQSPRTRTMSQVSPTAKNETPTLLPAEPPQPPPRPSTAAGKPKRAARKMSLTTMPGPLGNMFGRKDRDKERDRGGVFVGRSQSAVATESTTELLNDTSWTSRAV